MALIHFIWAGPFQDYEGICTSTPNDIAAQCPNHQIIYWLLEEAAEVFTTHLDLKRGNMKWESCNSVQGIVGNALYNGTNNKWYVDAQEILTQLKAAKAYSAIKDLLSLIILHRYGGFYFDTTTRITPGTGVNQLNQSLANKYDTPRVVKILSSSKHALGLQNATAILGGADARFPSLYVSVDGIDVWAMYGPAGHVSLELMFMSYVSRCNRMGLYPGGEDQPLNFDLIDGNDILKQTQGGKQSPRNNLIGRLIIHAVYDGLLVACCQGDSAKLSNYCWTAKMPQDGPSPRPSLTVPELGIDKYYRGTWRILAPTT